MKKSLMLLGVAGYLVSQTASAQATKSGLDKWLGDAENKALWSKYCSETGATPSVPKVNYKDPLVKKAADKLKTVSDKSYYFYGDIMRVYGLKAKGKYTPQAGVEEKDLPANAFFVYLCGEFRDRATMIREKLTWVSNINKVAVGKQPKIDLTKPLWQQIAAESYSPYLAFSAQLWEERREAIGYRNLAIKGGEKELMVDKGVPALSICENKYIFSQFISEGKPFPEDLKTYEDGLAAFSKGAKNCSKTDLEYYNTFRGDTNFKPYSPESNGMIWRATHMAKWCDGLSKAKPAKTGEQLVTDADCADYFSKPFLRRWEAARAGLATWLFYAPAHHEVFSDTQELVMIYPNKDASKGPFPYNFTKRDPSANSAPAEKVSALIPEWEKIQKTAWGALDLGFNKVYGVGPKAKSNIDSYERLRNAVDRHTDWYASGSDDGRDKIMDQAYSPFVASSYEMNQSNGFVNCGMTIPCGDDSDDRKHWMFVFKVKKTNWYTTDRLVKGDKVDFSKMWIDETSFGTTHLAKAEHAWDRLGTAVEGEYEAILYLHNITTYDEIKPDGLPQPEVKDAKDGK